MSCSSCLFYSFEQLTMFFQQIIPGNGCFSIPIHTPVIMSESFGTGRTLLRFLAVDASGETEQCLLSEITPPWIYDVVVKVKLTVM